MAVAGISPAAEGKGRGRHGGGQVGVNVGGVKMVGEVIKVFSRGGEDRGGEAKRHGVVGGDGGLVAFHRNQIDDRGEEFHLGGRIGDIRGGGGPKTDARIHVISPAASNFLVDLAGFQKFHPGGGGQRGAVALEGAGVDERSQPAIVS